MIFEPGMSIALELIALSVGALLVIFCHRYNNQATVFPKFIGYFTIIIAFITLIGSIISCFIYWMDGGTRDISIDPGLGISPPVYQPDSRIQDHEEAIQPPPALDNYKTKDQVPGSKDLPLHE
jgi:hypothetical protein